MSTCTYGRVAGWSSIDAWSERDPGTSPASPSMQIHAFTFGSLGRRSATTGANSCWKNSTSQSNASRT
jgi:hypothetical protein